MRFSSSIRPRPQLKPPLDRLKGGPVDDGLVGVLVGVLHPIPLTLRGVDDDLGLVADLPPPALNHHTGVHLIRPCQA